MVNKLKADFKRIFERESEEVFFSPGRVNLIGEHTDYNGGHVFPCALSFGTYGVVSKRNDKKVRMYSLNFEEIGIVEFDLDSIKYDKKHDWVNYPKGVVKVIQDKGNNIEHGLDILVYGNIPNGAGLSSSASLELLMAVILNDTFNLNIDMVDMVKYSQEAENKFIGVNCGIMDQFAIGMGQDKCAILLDCNTLKYRYSEINMEGCSIVIGNTNKRRGLADSKYNERRSECERALSNLQTKLDIKSLGELSEEEFETNKELIENEIDRKRAKHAVYENQRTIKAVAALKENNIELFGQLMNETHVSLRDDYEVSCKETDILAELAWANEGVLGARITGGGFGGCTVNIVKNDCVDKFIENVGAAYREKVGHDAEIYVAEVGDGASVLN